MINNKGSASVFLLFLFVILLGAVGLLLECSRFAGIKNYTKSMAEVTGKTVLTEYYRPLYQDYHIFFMAFGQGEDKEQYVKERAKEYMDYSLNPTRDMPVWKGVMYRKPYVVPDRCFIAVSNVVTAEEQEGKPFEREAISYIRYKSLGNVVKRLRKTTETVQSLKSGTEAVAEKFRCEEVLSEYSDNMLKLIKAIDGIEFNQKGKPQTGGCFVKQLLTEQPSMNSTGINNQQLWIKLKNKYINVNEKLQAISQKALENEKLLEGLDKAEAEAIQQEQDKSKKKEKKVQQEIQEGKVEQIQGEIDENITDIKSDLKELSETVEGVKQKTEEAILILGDMESAKDNIGMQIKKYKEKMNQTDPDLRESLSEDVKSMESVTRNGLNVNDMEQILQNNMDILKSLPDFKAIRISSGNDSMEGVRSTVRESVSLFQSYNTKSLSFQYGNTLSDKAANPLIKIKQLLQTKISDLVLSDKVSISKQKLSHTTFSAPNDESMNLGGILESIKSCSLINGIGNSFQVLSGKNVVDKNEVNNLADKVLMLFYEEDHFSNYLSTEKTEKERCLLYELEYILNGENSDKENLDSTIDKIVLWRTVFNFISILGDSEKREIAKSTAVAIAGITGIAPLIQVTETLILLTWSFDEALTDTAAVLQGKWVPIFKRGQDFSIQYSDLLVISQKLIQEKASLQEETVKGGIGYQTFLELFILSHSQESNRYHCMELVNQNIGIRYNKEFDLHNTIYSFQLAVKCETGTRFRVLQLGNQKSYNQYFNGSCCEVTTQGY